MDLEKKVYLTWVAYNEERTLPQSVKSVELATDYARENYPFDFKGVICHNGCTDNTPEIAMQLAESSSFDIQVISSDKGMVKAQNKSIEYIKKVSPVSPVVFIDADCIVNKDVIYLFLEQFEKHHSLMAVGAHPIPTKSKIKNPFKKLIHNVLNFRAYHPKAQIAKVYAPEYHPFADTDPIPIGSEFEKKSKSYFHGRCFAIRNTEVWDVPSDAIGEDTFLDCSIHKRFGPGSIRLLYHANVYFNPIDSFSRYIRTYARIYKDKEELKKKDIFFKETLKYSETRLDVEYAKTLPLSEKIYFHMYHLLDETTNFLFSKGMFVNNSLDKLWTYTTKKRCQQ